VRLPGFRLTMLRMMVATAILAVLCASLPYPFADPIATLTSAVLVASILVVPGRHQDPRLFKGVLLLAIITVLTVVGWESYSLWQNAARYRRLHLHHTWCESVCEQRIRSFDKDPREAGSKAHWAIERRRSLQWVEYHGQLRQIYDYAARHPWLPVEPDPPVAP
jgi:hypothetical protein